MSAMKIANRFLILFCPLILSGCASTLVVNQATLDRDFDAKQQRVVGPVHVGYYFLLPAAVPFDVVTFPIQWILLPGMVKDIF
jgi:hypothetical protein